ncbi:sensor histidine kinase [Microbacterium sp. CJ88]|uniref:sensor histidine kinase n=1 Tax=Microbacterium sp. CJ88 TaxID=3445672 RepID=UPI003F659324
MFRRFWARHPRAADILIAFWATVLSLPAATVRSPYPDPPSTAQVWLAVAAVLAGGIMLVWRRRRPLTAFMVATVPIVLLPPSLSSALEVLPAFALYAIAVYRGVRACWIAFAVAAGLLSLYGIRAILLEPAATGLHISSFVFGILALLIGTLLGINVGNRHRYTEALIDRSRQLLVERDRRAEHAAAAERTRIAREMHDIVSHSLTVVVALSEGAAAAPSTERSRQASLAAAETARGALEEMRAMLGVLRDTTEAASPLAPLEPVDPAEVVATAQRAGYPVVVEITGSTRDAPRAVRFALGRVVQEAVTNAMRHAPDARTVQVRVSAADSTVRVEVTDDGAGAAAPHGGGGFGLRGLRERIDLVGGTFSAGPIPGGGWRVQAELPLPPSAPAPTQQLEGSAP